MNAEEIHDLAAAYALDAVDDRERVLFEAHLAGCEPCRREVQELSEAAGTLSEDLAETPPAGLRERLLQQVAHEPQQTSLAGGGADVPSGELLSLDRVRRSDVRRRGSRLSGWPLAAAAAAVIGVGTVVAVQVLPEDDPGAALATQVLEADDARRSTERLENATLTVVSAASVGRSVLVAEDLPELSADQDYQLWFVGEDGSVTSAGLIEDDAPLVEVLLEDEVAAAVGVAITVEPTGGVEQPSTAPLVVVPVEG